MQNLYKTAAVVTLFTAFEHFLGFLYRIILSRTLGSEGLGVYQVALTVFAVFITVSSSGLPITLSRVISKHRARGYKRGEYAATSSALLITLLFSVPITLLLFLIRTPFSRIFADPRSADLFYILLFSLSFTSVYAIIRGCFWGNRRFFAYSFIELIEEIVMIVVGVLLIVFIPAGPAKENKAAVAVLVSYLSSFSIAVVYFFAKGGKLASPRGEFLPLLKSSLPVTAMRTSSSLMSSLISVLFPMRLMAAGCSSARAMSEYGVVYGMVMPVLMVPGTLISSIALVLVPELSECFYKKEKGKLASLVEKALCYSVLIACVL
ncbi:MAG: oligosaccharide flippase family protein, partial [Candidatus Gallimonas sp.]